MDLAREGIEMTMWKCEKCGEIRFDDSQTCDCKKFTVVDENGEDYNVQAICEEDAAIKHAEMVNDEGDLVGESVDILVDGNAYRISAEIDVCYSATKL